MWTLTACAENQVSPREDQRPLRDWLRASEDPSDTRSMLFWLVALGKHSSKLIGCRHSVQTRMPELCSFQRKVLPDVDVPVLRSFSATTHIVGPLDTHRCWRFGLETNIP